MASNRHVGEIRGAKTLSRVIEDSVAAASLDEANRPIGSVETSQAAPALSGLAASVTFDENVVNAGPQLIDNDVSFDDVDGDVANGRVTVSGLLAEDRVAIRNEGVGAGQIGVSGSSVTYGGTVIGTFTGGTGGTFTVALNNAATVSAVDALIQNLTYQNVSEAPVASRTLRINVIDATGTGIGDPAVFTALSGAADPFNGLDVGTLSKPTFLDFDGDGDLDLVSGHENGQLYAFRNNGVGTAFIAVTGAANPFNSVDVGVDSTPAAVDFDGDGDLDLVVGDNDGALRSFRNNGNGTFSALTGTPNPFNGIDVGFDSAPAFVDFDGDGDMDLATGETNGTLISFRNNGNGTFTQLAGAANPFNGIDVGLISAPSFLDFDADGDLDALIGEQEGIVLAYRNNGDGTFTNVTGAANPFNSLDTGFDAALAFVDLDGDGDLDAVSGARDGFFVTFRNDATNGVPITVNVTAQNEAPTVMLTPAGGAFARVGTEILVNTTTAGNQSLPQITTLSNGGFVVTWQDASASGGDPVGTAIRAQIYTANGTPVGTEILVNTATANNQNAPQIIALSNGGFAVSWNDGSLGAGGAAGDTTGFAIKAQVFGATGTPVGTEIRVNTATAGDQTIPDMTALSNGGFVLTWQDLSVGVGGATGDASSVAVKGQVFGPGGAPVGGEFLVNTATVGNQLAQQITALAGGGFVVTWTDGSAGTGGAGGDTSSNAIKAQVFGVNGTPVGAEIRVNSATQGGQDIPQITALANGGFVVTWRDQSASVGGATGDNSGSAVKAQVFAAGGTPVGAEILVNSAVQGSQEETQIIALSNGGFVATWRDGSMGIGGASGDFSQTAVKAQVFGANGVPVGSEILVNTSTSAIQGSPVLTPLADGRFVIVWQDFIADGELKAQVFAANGAKLGGELAVNSATAGTQGQAQVTALPNGGFVVTWNDASAGVGGATGDATGSAIKAQVFGPRASYAATEQTSLSLKGGKTIADPDSGAGVVTATLSVGYGVLTVTAGNSGVTIVSGSGTGTVVVSGTVAQLNALLSQESTSTLTYNPNTNAPPASTTFTISVNDNGTGGGAAQIGSASETIAITAINDLPVVTPGTGSAAFVEGVLPAASPLVAVAPALTVSDPDHATLSFASIGITGNFNASQDVLAFTNNNAATFGNIAASYDGATGLLTLTSAGATATLAQFQAALRAVTYTNTSEEPSTATRTLTFLVNDGPNTGVSGSRTITVTAQNDPPSGANQTLTIDEDQVRTLSASDFGFTDIDGDAFAGVRFGSAPTGGTLFYDADGAGAGVPVAITSFPTGTYTAADFTGRVTFVPTANLNGNGAAAITFSVVDNGGTTGGGQNTDSTPNTLTFNITPVADAPVSANFSATFDEDTIHVFTLADFPFSDADGDNFYSLMVDSHPVAGGLFFDPGGPNGTNRTDLRDFGTNFQVFASDIAAGKLFYIPAANGNGAAYASFQFRVRSDNHVSGVYDSVPHSFTFNVTAVNDAPVNGVPGAQNVDEGQALVLSAANGNALSVSDVDATTLTVTLTVANGTLTLGDTTGLNFSAGDGADDATMTFSGTPAAINAALGTGGLTYSPNGGFSGPDAIAFTTSDNGQTGTGPAGTDSDSIAVTVNDLNVAPVLDLNGAAAGASVAITVNEGDIFNPATNAIVSDVDSANFDGGSMTVGYSAGATTSDSVFITDEGGQFAGGGRIGVSFNDVYYNGVLIGTISSAGLGLPLVVTLNANATPAAVQRLVQQVNTINISDSPPAGARPLTYTLTDGDGGSSSAIADVTITPQNDGPVIDGLANFTVMQTEDASNGSGAIAPGAIVTDDSADFDGGSLTVAMTSPYNGRDSIGILGNGIVDVNAQREVTVNGVVIGTVSGGVFDNNGTLTITFNGDATPARVQELVRAIYVQEQYGELNGGTRTFDVTLTDGDGGASMVYNGSLVVTAINDEPAGTDKTITINEDMAYALTVADFGFDSGTQPFDFLEGDALAAVFITTLPTGGTLYLDTDGAGTGSLGTAVITNQRITVADISAGRLVYVPAANVNGVGAASFTFQVQDDNATNGTGPGSQDTDQSPNTLTFDVALVNDAPTLANLQGDSGAITESQNGTSSQFVLIDAGGDALVTDLDSADFNGGTLEVRITSGFQAGEDRLGFTGNARVTIAGEFILVDGEVIGTFTGGGPGDNFIRLAFDSSAATSERVQEVIRAVFQSNTSSEPIVGVRGLTVTLTDGDGGSVSAIASVTIIGTNDAPVIGSFNNGTATFTEGNVATAVDVGQPLTISDIDSANFDGGTLTFRISVNHVATEDQLDLTGANGITVDGSNVLFNGVQFATVTTGGVGQDRVFSFNANATPQAVQALARGLTYTNVNQDNPSVSQRTIQLVLTDGDGGTTTVMSRVNVVAINDAPVVDLDAAAAGNDNTASYTEQAPVVTLASAISLSDVDNATLTGAMVRITGGFVPLAGDGADYLGIGGSGAGQINGINYEYSALTGILTLSGTASLAAYQAVLAQVTFQSTTNNPGTSRTISWTVTDGTTTSAAATTTITVTPVNDNPVNSVPGGTQDATEDTDFVFSTANGNAIVIVEPDSPTVTVTLNVANGVLTLATLQGLSFTTGDGTGDPTITFTGLPADVNAALNGLIYRGNLNFNGSDSLTITSSDGGAPQASTVAIGIAPDGSIDGDAGDNTLDGTPQADYFDLSQGGNEDLRGYEGNDGFYFGAAYDQNDVIDGGASNRDQIGLQGDYSAGVTLGSLLDVELVVLLAGNDARFGGQTGTDLNYSIIADGNTIVSDNKLIIQANLLRAGESLTFNGSASGIDFLVYGGLGTDNLTGGSGDDGFFFGDDRFGVNDLVDGGAGVMDQLGLQGDYSGANAITFGASQLLGLEFIVLLSASDNRFGSIGGVVDYNLTMNDGNVAAGETMVVSANTSRAGEELVFNGSAEMDGRFEVYSGNGNDVITGGAGDDLIFGGGSGDTLTGGAGNDVFAYRSVTDSNSTERDGIQDFTLGDRIDLSRIDANLNAGGKQDFSFVGTAAFSGTAGELRYENISLGGPIYLVQGDVNGDGISDLEIVLVMTDRNQLTTGDFIGVNPAAVPLLVELEKGAVATVLFAGDEASPDLVFIGADYDVAVATPTNDLLL